MDPALQEVLREGDVDEAVPAIVRLTPGQAPPPHLRVVARFGDIATVRVRRGDVGEAYASDAIASFKAVHWLMPEPGDGDESGTPSPGDAPEERPADQRRDPAWPTGQRSVVAALDWGLDFTHPDFRHADGRTRLRALWDQGARYNPRHPNRYGYGRVFDRASIDAALRSSDPFAALGYEPRRTDRGSGTHGTHVLGIAAGNGRSGGPQGLAPEAELLFVHMGTSAGHGGPQALTDSAAVLEGLDFVHRMAGQRPACINLSMGTHGGPHDGSTLVERGIDAFLMHRPGRYVVQSTGNYFSRRVHSAGRLAVGERATLPMLVDVDDTTPNDLELWYAGSDEFHVSVLGPDGAVRASAALGDTARVLDGGQEIGRLYHRRRDPNNFDHQVMLRLDAPAAVGRWSLAVEARRVVDGRWHAWIERDSRCAPCQSTFPADRAVRSTTTGSICNGRESIVVGAIDGAQPSRPLGRFSSAGPTRDGRSKPDLVAPGVRVLSARSRPLSGADAPLLTRMSGSSMAAPHVTGTLALLCDTLGHAPGHRALRDLIRRSCRAHAAGDPLATQRTGAGHLDTAAALRLAERLRPSSNATTTAPRENAMTLPPNPHTPPSVETHDTAHADADGAADEFAEAFDDADDADESRRRRRTVRRSLPLIAPVIGPGGLGAAVVAPIGGTAIIAPLTPGVGPAPPPAPAPAPVPATPAAATCACATPAAAAAPSTGGVAVASSEPTVAADPPAESEAAPETHVHWTTAPKDWRDAAESALAEQAFVDGVETGTAGLSGEHALFHGEAFDDESFDEGGETWSALAFTGPPEHDELAEQSIRDAPGQSIGQLVHDLLARAGWNGGEDESFDERSLGGGAVAARLFDHFTGRRHVLPAPITGRFEIVALPGGTPGALRAGDWLLRRGEGGVAHVSIIATPRLWPAAALLAQGWQPENRRPGGFAHVIDLAHGGRLRDDRFARRICDSAQRVPRDTLLLRPRTARGFGEGLEADESVDARWLQQALNRVLGTSLAVDGSVGPQTRAAIRQFQSREGLVADGIVGPLTEAALRRALGGASGGGAGQHALTPARGGGAPGTAPCTTLDTFAQGRWDLTLQHHSLLHGLALRIQRERIRDVEITGFASTEGDVQSNFILGQRRADAVAEGLRQALDDMRHTSRSSVSIRTQSRGEHQPIAGGTPQQNRRVEVCLRAPVRPPARPPRPQPPVQPPVQPIQTKVFRVTGKSFINVVGSRIGRLNCGIDIGPVRIPGLSNQALPLLARGTDASFSENPGHDRVFTAPPPNGKGYRLFSQGRVEAVARGGILVDVRLVGALARDAGKECIPDVPWLPPSVTAGACLEAPPLIIDRAFSTSRISATSMRFTWGVKGRPPEIAEVVFSGICLRSSVYIWHVITGTVEIAGGVPTITSLDITGSQFPSHRAWVDGVVFDHQPQGPLSNLWNAAASDPTRVA
jgi:peptidoglycan hydrolase-like protein with peptidoglycan-binding domain